MRDRYRQHGVWTERSLPAELVEAASTFSDHPAVVTEEVTLTYTELFELAARFAAGLLSETTLRPGHPVMFQMGNVAETVVAYVGALLAGLRPVCTLPQHGSREVRLLAEHVGARGLFFQADFGKGQLPGQAQELLGNGTITEVVSFRGGSTAGATRYEDLIRAHPTVDMNDLPYHDMDPWQIAVFQLSGGTTGLPKVAPRMHEEYTYNSRAWAAVLGWGPGTRVLYPLPIMHNAGIVVGLQPALLSGSALLLAPNADATTVLDFVERLAPTSFPLVPPAVAIRVLEHPRSSSVDFSCLEDFIVGGQKLSLEFALRLKDELGISIRQKFGMAEGMFLVTPRDAGEFVRFNTVGAPLSALDEVRVMVPGTTEEAPLGTIGEFCARGPYTIRGYFNAPAHTSDAFTHDGFYRTGDLCRAHRVDGETYYSIEGRIKDVINRGAEKIHAEEVEEVLLRHSMVANVAVVAMPDRELGERVCAYLILEPGAPTLSVAEVGEFLLGEGLAKFKLPERIESTNEFPLTNVGKVSKKALREDLVERMQIS